MGATRASAVTLNHATITTKGNSGANDVQRISGALTIGSGQSIVTITPNAAKNSRVEAGSFVRQTGGTVLFRGTNLGLNTIASATANSASVQFTSAPALQGGILAGAYGDTSASTGTGSGFTTGGLVTYDADYGVRLLTAAEYANSISDGAVNGNVQLANSSGTGIATTTLDTDTSVNSISFRVSGANTTEGSGITIDGAGVLTLNSGVIYAHQAVTGATGGGNLNNRMTINSPSLDLNGQEGMLIVATSNVSNSVANGRLEIGSAITNGTGLTKNGSGEARLNGATHKHLHRHHDPSTKAS